MTDRTNTICPPLIIFNLRGIKRTIENYFSKILLDILMIIWTKKQGKQKNVMLHDNMKLEKTVNNDWIQITICFSILENTAWFLSTNCCLFFQQTSFGCCVGKSPNLFLSITRCFENLSSGENLAGWAERVGHPFGSTFW